MGADDPPRRSWGGSRPLAAIFLATFFVRFSFGITLAVFFDYLTGQSGAFAAQSFGTPGLVSAMAPVGEFTTVLAFGAAADRWGRYPVLFGGMATAAILFVAVSTTRDPIALGVLNFGFGVGSGAILAASLAVVGDVSGAGERGLEMGRFDAVNLSGWVGGFAVGFATLASVPNGRLGAIFLVGAGALLAGLAGARLLLRGLAASAPPARFSLRNVLVHAFRWPVLVVTLPWLAIYALIGAALAFLAPAATGAGVPADYLALAIGAGGGLLVLTQPYFGGWADRWGRTRLMTVGVAGFVLVLVFASLALAEGHPVWTLIGLGASALPALAYGPAALAALADLAHAISRATTMAIYSLTISLGMVVGIVGASQLIAHYGDPGLYPFFGGIAVALVVLTAARALEDARATTPVR